MKKHLKRLLSVMLAALLCLGIVPSSVFAAEYEYDGYISMIDHMSGMTRMCFASLKL